MAEKTFPSLGRDISRRQWCIRRIRQSFRFCSPLEDLGTFIGKHHDRQSRISCPRTIGLATLAAIHSVFIFHIGMLTSHESSGNFMSYIITGTDSAGALSLKRDSAAAAIKKSIELMADGCRDVCITDPDGRIYSHAEFDQLRAAERAE
jgi:hypothetical protein